MTRADIREQGLPLPPGDYVPETAEETLVLYADKFHSKKSPPVFVSAATYAVSVSRFGAGKAARFSELVAAYGEPDLEPLVTEYGHQLV
ncbi:hypothetical protein [Actinoplanes awajinensis]|uniref:hypothetical protein n=1 Tax=Actinoplanes awajinensis TaxID=135946 RepID=UPI000A419E89|nr:hypothetical protein [Actinoplanes awajinensis]